MSSGNFGGFDATSYKRTLEGPSPTDPRCQLAPGEVYKPLYIELNARRQADVSLEPPLRPSTSITPDNPAG